MQSALNISTFTQ